MGFTTLEAPVTIVEEDYKQVFLVWKCQGCGYDLASDTFIFNQFNKIVRQNIMVVKKEGKLGSTSFGASPSSPGKMAAQPQSGVSSAKASKKKDSKKKLSSKKKKGGIC